MIEFGRTDRSVVGRWWWTVDRWTLAVCLLTMAVGIVLIMAASPAVADRIGLRSFHFVWRQILFLIPALIILFGMSLLPVVWVRRIAVVGFLMSLILLCGFMYQQSPSRAARLMAGLALAPIQIGGCGRCNGLGQQDASLSAK